MRDKERRLYDRLSRLEETPKTYTEVELFPPPGPLRLTGPDLSPCDIAERLRPAVRSWGQQVEPVLCMQADWAPTDELHQVPAGMRSRSTPGQSLPRVQCHGIVLC